MKELVFVHTFSTDILATIYRTEESCRSRQTYKKGSLRAIITSEKAADNKIFLQSYSTHQKINNGLARVVCEEKKNKNAKEVEIRKLICEIFCDPKKLKSRVDCDKKKLFYLKKIIILQKNLKRQSHGQY